MVNAAVQNLVNKYPEKTIVVPASGESHGLPSTHAPAGVAKVEVVGHGGTLSLGGLNGNEISEMVKRLAINHNTQIGSVNLVGCSTSCVKEGNSLVSIVTDQLLRDGMSPRVKGYDKVIRVDEHGRKVGAQADEPTVLGAVSDSQESASSVPDRKGSIKNALENKRISAGTAAYLGRLKSKILDLLASGPVLLGENHGIPNAELLVEDLIDAHKVSRVLLELPPFGDRRAWADMHVEKDAHIFSLLDQSVGSLSEIEQNTPHYNDLREIVECCFAEKVPGKFDIVNKAFNDGVNIDLVDGGRADDADVNVYEELYARNKYISDKLNGDEKYKAPGVIGIFGGEHLRSRIDPSDKIMPAIQEMIGIPEDRVLDTRMAFKDQETGQEYFPDHSRFDEASNGAKMSDYAPYKQLVQKNGDSDGVPVYGPQKKYHYLIVNMSPGSEDKGFLAKIAKHPSTHTAFTVNTDGQLDYFSGITRKNRNVVKSYVYGAPDDASYDISPLLKQAATKIGWHYPEHKIQQDKNDRGSEPSYPPAQSQSPDASSVVNSNLSGGGVSSAGVVSGPWHPDLLKTGNSLPGLTVAFKPKTSRPKVDGQKTILPGWFNKLVSEPE